MKRILSLFLVCTMFLTGCGLQNKNNTDVSTAYKENGESINVDANEINFPSLDDKELLNYIEDGVYNDLIDKLDSDEYFIEDITTKYISKEYLDEVAYNSQSNIYFGFTLEELVDQFEDEKFIFTLGEDGKTEVKEFEGYENTYDEVIRNVATGAGVIIIRATISTALGVGPSISTIFALSAANVNRVALSKGVISDIIFGILTGIQTKDFEEDLDAACLEASERFKWAAILGVKKASGL